VSLRIQVRNSRFAFAHMSTDNKVGVGNSGDDAEVNKENPNLDCPPNVIRMIKSMRITWVGYVARMGAMRNAYTNSGSKT
jgi:hypothetical protein